MKVRILAVCFLFLFSLVFCPLLLQAASEGSCIKCHGEEGVMKSLFKAPIAPAGEGEG